MKGQIIPATHLAQLAGKLNNNHRFWLCKHLTWGPTDSLYPTWECRPQVDRFQLPTLRYALKIYPCNCFHHLLKGIENNLGHSHVYSQADIYLIQMHSVWWCTKNNACSDSMTGAIPSTFLFAKMCLWLPLRPFHHSTFILSESNMLSTGTWTGFLLSVRIQ